MYLSRQISQVVPKGATKSASLDSRHTYPQPKYRAERYIRCLAGGKHTQGVSSWESQEST